MSQLDVVVYPNDLNAAEAAFLRLGWEVTERSGDPQTSYAITFRLPADSVQLSLITHDVARQLAGNLGSDTVAGLVMHVDDADAAWQAARLAGLRIDPVSAERPSEESWGRLVRTYTPGGLRIDFLQPPVDGVVVDAAE
jgi:hypothetical protein